MASKPVIVANSNDGEEKQPLQTNHSKIGIIGNPSRPKLSILYCETACYTYSWQYLFISLIHYICRWICFGMVIKYLNNFQLIFILLTIIICNILYTSILFKFIIKHTGILHPSIFFKFLFSYTQILFMPL